MSRGKSDEWLTEEALLLLEGWAREGLIDEQLAQKMGIGVRTLYEWKNKYPQISQALKKGKEVIDFEVERKLLDTALGFKVKVLKPIKVKTEKHKVGDSKVIEEKVVYAEEEIYIPPNPTAQIFWLKNRKPEKWRDKPAVSDGPDEPLEKYLEGMRNA